jgi:hypothetical protein
VLSGALSSSHWLSILIHHLVKTGLEVNVDRILERDEDRSIRQ